MGLPVECVISPAKTGRGGITPVYLHAWRAGLAAGDPRASILERYPKRSVYLAKMTEAALRLQREGFLLDEDVVAIVHDEV